MSFITKHLLPHRSYKRLLKAAQLVSLQRRPMHTTCCVLRRWGKDGDEDRDRPVKFSTSKAARFRDVETFTTPERDVPEYQAYVVAISLAVFLIYFLCLREENDIDNELSTSLYDRIPGLERNQLKLSIDYNREHGKPTEDLEARLSELDASAKQ